MNKLIGMSAKVSFSLSLRITFDHHNILAFILSLGNILSQFLAQYYLVDMPVYLVMIHLMDYSMDSET